MKWIFDCFGKPLILFSSFTLISVLIVEASTLEMQPSDQVVQEHISESPDTITTPDVQLATRYAEPSIISDYLVSEKLDGVRGFWDGSRMFTRSGRPVYLPQWFSKGFPSIPLDGELWLGRGEFDSISALVRTSHPEPHLWKPVKFMVFDVPKHQGVFAERYQYAKSIVSDRAPYLAVIEQVSLASNAQLNDLLKHVVSGGGEGLMLHHKQAMYRSGRNSQLMKLKPYYDAEAEVIGYKPGKGKLLGMTGALIVRSASGQVFSIGSGLTQVLRQRPPEIGSIVTFQFHGYTSNGVPRFASFLRVRHPDEQVGTH